jgi:hypothetical protein
MAKGMKTGGRGAGVPNKFSSVRAVAVEREGKRLPPANLLLIAENSMAMAGRYQPEIFNKDAGKMEPNPNYNEERYGHWLDRACDALAKAAPYYSPRLHAVAIATPPSEAAEDDASRTDPRETMWQMYKSMRERGELALKTVGSSQTELNPDTPQPEPAVAVEEDNGDGVAV